jgi:hypothetical protein
MRSFWGSKEANEWKTSKPKIATIANGFSFFCFAYCKLGLLGGAYASKVLRDAE